MRIAITGGSGFIGDATTDEAVKRGHEVWPIDHRVGIDVRSGEAAYTIARADAVIHLAGVLGTGELFDFPEQAVEVNVLGTLNVLKACEGGTRYVGITMPDVWRNVYQATKRCSMDLASAWHQHRGVEVSHVRAYNVYGPGQKYGRPQKIIPTFSVKAWVGRPIPIWGDGEQTVDLVYVGDVARMLVDVTELEGHDGVFDAGTGQPLTVNEVATFVSRVVGGGFEVEHLPMRPGETSHTQVIAIGEGWAELGWAPRSAPDRLRETVLAYEEVSRKLAVTLV